MPNLHELLKEMIDKGASDLHITTGIPPMIRLHGHLAPVGSQPLAPAETKAMAYSILTDAQKQKFEEQKELDLSFGVKGLSRFRANIFVQRGAVAVAIRTIPFKILNFDELGLPATLQQFADAERGLVLVVGAAGNGKSSTQDVEPQGRRGLPHPRGQPGEGGHHGVAGAVTVVPFQDFLYHELPGESRHARGNVIDVDFHTHDAP